MQFILRKIETLEQPATAKLKAIGFNSNNVLTIVCSNEEGDFLINLHKDELALLRKFLSRID